jgi:hypothetical protein
MEEVLAALAMLIGERGLSNSNTRALNPRKYNLFCLIVFSRLPIQT